MLISWLPGSDFEVVDYAEAIKQNEKLYKEN